MTIPNRKYSKIFNDPKKLLEMLRLRRKGWNYPKLAKKYSVNHASIMYQCNKPNNKLYLRHGINLLKDIPIGDGRSLRTRKRGNWVDESGNVINAGKRNYKDYQEANKK